MARHRTWLPNILLHGRNLDNWLATICANGVLLIHENVYTTRNALLLLDDVWVVLLVVFRTRIQHQIHRVFPYSLQQHLLLLPLVCHYLPDSDDEAAQISQTQNISQIRQS